MSDTESPDIALYTEGLIDDEDYANTMSTSEDSANQEDETNDDSVFATESEDSNPPGLEDEHEKEQFRRKKRLAYSTGEVGMISRVKWGHFQDVARTMVEEKKRLEAFLGESRVTAKRNKHFAPISSAPPFSPFPLSSEEVAGTYERRASETQYYYQLALDRREKTTAIFLHHEEAARNLTRDMHDIL